MKDQVNSTPFRTIIGSNHGQPRSRIWLEGARLLAAGFPVGTRYTRLLGAGIITLTRDPAGPYKVSGKGAKPIIDLTGKLVTQMFPAPQTHVLATFTADVITLSPE